MRIVFLRHGESMGNVWGGAYENDDTNFLSLRGIKQAELSAYTVHDWMPEVDAVITSKLTRARQTATTVMQTMGDWKRSYTQDIRLNEWCWDHDGGQSDWFLAEDSADFWTRIGLFYQQYIVENQDLGVNFMIVSHYYTMQGLFEYIRADLGMDNMVGQDLDPHNHGDIPNAIPWFYDSKEGRPPQIILPGHNDRSR